MSNASIFISYRREDLPGYAGRLEDALERELGSGSIFRDVRDIRAGDDFTAALAARLAGARAMLVLIGPRWHGPLDNDARRIDDPSDFVRIEVAAALNSTCRVFPILLAGTLMPSESSLPELLRPLARRQALSLADASWDADVARIVGVLAEVATPLRRKLWASLAALALVLMIGGVFFVQHLKNVAAAREANLAAQLAAKLAAEQSAAVNAMLGAWRAKALDYGWGEKFDETFVFKRHAGEVTGTASYLRYPRGIENLKIEGNNIHFTTHTRQSVNDVERELTHQYAAERKGDVLLFRLSSTGGYTTSKPFEFEARKITSEALEKP